MRCCSSARSTNCPDRTGPGLKPLAALLLLAATAAGDPLWRLDISGGSAWNAATPLTIRQEGEEPVRFIARYRTRPFADVPYYAVRVGRGRAARWEAELIHHKIYLDNPPPEVEQFRATHGFNLLSLGRSWPVGRARPYADRRAELRFGAGPMLTHPISIVRGRAYEGGRYLFGTGWLLSGIGVQFGAGHRWRLGRAVELVAEFKATAALAELPVADGRAETPNAALHGLLGLGFRL